MRNIKFRAWDTKQKAMFPVHKMEFHKIDNELVHLSGVDIHHKDSDFHGDVYYGGPANKMTGTPPVKRFVIMQYIGRKDREKNEMYEKDIIEDGEGNLGVIIWNEDECGFFVDFGEGYDLQTPSDWCIVVGNIYQHHHLLGES